MLFSLSIPFIGSRNSRTHPYLPVPPPDEEILLSSPDNKETISTSSKRTFYFDLSFWMTTLAMLSIAITVRNLLVIQLRSQEPHVGYVEASIARPYNGLETLVRNESSPSWPLSSTLYPDFVGASEGTRLHHTLSNGSIARLDSERAIIIQHRVQDHGLEHCAVKLELASTSTDGGRGNGHEHAARGFGHIGDSPYLTLWRLDDPGDNNKAVFASSSLPSSLPWRREFLGNITLDGTRPAKSPFFGCSAGSIQTLEINVACRSDPCIMEFRLMRSPQRQGFWLIQSEQGSTP